MINDIVLASINRLVNNWTRVTFQLVPQKYSALIIILTNTRIVKQVFIYFSQKVNKFFRWCLIHRIIFYHYLRQFCTPVYHRWKTRITWIHHKNNSYFNEYTPVFQTKLSRISIIVPPIFQLIFDTSLVNVDESSPSGTVNTKTEKILPINLPNVHILRRKCSIHLHRITLPRYL